MRATCQSALIPACLIGTRPSPRNPFHHNSAIKITWQETWFLGSSLPTATPRVLISCPSLSFSSFDLLTLTPALGDCRPWKCLSRYKRGLSSCATFFIINRNRITLWLSSTGARDYQAWHDRIQVICSVSWARY